MPIELTHIGEPIVAAMLSSLARRDLLGNVQCRASHASLAQDAGTTTPEFLADEARLTVVSAEQRYSCDGAQTVDVLCAGPERAVAIEAKLGDTRMTFGAFRERSCQ